MIRGKAFCLVLLLLVGCSERNVNGGTDTHEPAHPDYRAHGALKGMYRWGFETSAIHLCDTSRNECLSLNGPDNGCWVEFTEAAYRQLVALRGNEQDGDEFGEVWLEGSGRLAETPGKFGHMGDYDCQVEFAEVNAIDAGLPWASQTPAP